MPIGKNASYRYRLIDQCLRDKGRRWTFDSLRNHITEMLWEEFDITSGVSTRQLADDFRIMRKDPPEGYGAPIIRRGGFVYYEDSDFSILDNPLNEDDFENLKEVQRLLKPFERLPQFRIISSVLEKLRGSTIGNRQDGVIQLEHNPLVKGLEHVGPLYEIIKKKQQVKLSYQPFPPQEGFIELIHPFFIREYNNRWFLIAWHPTYNRFSSFALDRVVSFEPSEAEVEEAKCQELKELLLHLIGVSLGIGTVEEVAFEVSPKIAPYFQTKPLHSSQQAESVSERSGWTTYKLKVIPNIELQAELLRFGPDIKILRPEWLAQEVKNKVEKLNQLYS